MTGFKSTKLTTRKGCMLNDPPKMVHRSTLMQEIRYLDKLVDELAKGKSMEKIKR